MKYIYNMQYTRKLVLAAVMLMAVVQMIAGQTCPSSYFFNGQRCAPCLTNCQCSQ